MYDIYIYGKVCGESTRALTNRTHPKGDCRDDPLMNSNGRPSRVKHWGKTTNQCILKVSWLLYAMYKYVHIYGKVMDKSFRALG